MTKALRQGAILFIIVQLAGLASMLIWPFGRVTGPFLWGTAFIALFPGNIAAGLLVEKYLWNTGLSLRVLSIIEIPLLLLFNGFCGSQRSIGGMVSCEAAIVQVPRA